jgi:hypothetical protein
MSNTTNISPVVSPDILKVISTSTAIKTFGAQTKDKNKETTIIGDQTKTAELSNESDILTQKEKQAGLNKNNTIQIAQYNLNTNQITQDQYNKIYEQAEVSYLVEMDAIEVQRKKLEQDKEIIENNPYTVLENNQKKSSAEVKKTKKDTQNEENKSKKDLTKQIASNTVKTLVPIIALQLSNNFSVVISQRKKLEDLVDQVNNYIDTQVKDQSTVTIATNLRNNAITLINNNIKKLQSLEKTLKTITAVITIFSLVLRALSLIPTPVPPKVVITLEKANKLISGLSALLAVVTLLLSNEILKLNELRDRLKEASLKLDGKTLNFGDLNALSNEFLPTGGNYGSYKGFKFAIKEEQDQRFVVKGNKRRYAVAINRNGVEAIKSDFSFTQDPNDLIEQLKLIIDQQNLQG